MEVSGFNRLNYDIEEKALKGLLDTFGSMLTLQEIAFSYCNAGGNPDLTGEFFCDKLANTSTSSVHPSAGEARGKESSKSSNSNISENLFMQMENLDLLRQNGVRYLEVPFQVFLVKIMFNLHSKLMALF